MNEHDALMSDLEAFVKKTSALISEDNLLDKRLNLGSPTRPTVRERVPGKEPTMTRKRTRTGTMSRTLTMTNTSALKEIALSVPC